MWSRHFLSAVSWALAVRCLERVGGELVDLQVPAIAGGGGGVGSQLFEAAFELLGEGEKLSVFQLDETAGGFLAV